MLSLKEHIEKLILLFGFVGTLGSLPLFRQLYGIQPPDLDGLEYVFSGAVLVGSALLYRWRDQLTGQYDSWLIIAGVATGVFIGAYFIAYGLLVVDTEFGRIVTGLYCTKEAAVRFPQQCPFIPPHALLETAYVRELLWTETSITAARSLLLFLWLGFIVGLVGFGNIFVLKSTAEKQTPNAVATGRTRPHKKKPHRSKRGKRR